jgi:hypothetical protein
MANNLHYIPLLSLLVVIASCNRQDNAMFAELCQTETDTTTLPGKCICYINKDKSACQYDEKAFIKFTGLSF